MNIGILTFHWATNYGAILQAYCLQTYLEDMGNSVDIINYKPRRYDYSWYNLFRYPSHLKTIYRYIIQIKKEHLLEKFRKEYLHITQRYCSVKELDNSLSKYDILISGSDQVLNPTFTRYGENGEYSYAYWLKGGGTKTKKIGYSVSFGCEIYPQEVIVKAKEWVTSFKAIGVREDSGQKVLSQLEYDGEVCVTPDPTLLLGVKLFQRIGVSMCDNKSSYLCVYMLRYEVKVAGEVKYIDEIHHPISMEEWLKVIAESSGLLTNSYHGMIISILAHVPFVVLLEKGRNSGMNDRFFTLLKRLGLEGRVSYSLKDALALLKKPVDFSLVDKALVAYKTIGECFINRIIND